jgi:adenylate kinase
VPGVRLVIFGRQGAGKGTQCKLLSEYYRAPHISTGDMLREAVNEGTDFGRKAKEYLDNGQLLPDDIMLGIIEDRLHKDDVLEHGFLLDGYPRTVGQAQTLLDLEPIDLAVNIEVPEALVWRRISERRVCVSCGHIYKTVDRSAGSGVCEICGGVVEQRDDDKPAAITARLDTFSTKTLLAVAWFDSLGLLLDVDGVGTQDEVSARLARSIDERLARGLA